MVHYLEYLILTPILFALIMPFLSDKENGKQIHFFGILGSAILFFASLCVWFSGLPVEFSSTVPWIPSLGISFALGSDGLSMILVNLTTFLLLMASIASVSNINKRHKLYYAMLFILAASVMGVFLARDTFLFFLFWELELVPMYFLIAIWGGPRRDYAAMKFVLYTLFGSIFLVAGLLALYFFARSAGADPATLFLYTTVQKAMASGAPLGLQIFVFTCLFITFAVKLPMVPFHTWLPDAHVEAPTPISMLLAGILLKMGAYGMFRFCFGYLPEAANVAAPVVALLAFINIVYTAGVALVQTDMKKLIAYSSVSHMGFVLLGLAALNSPGFHGAVFVMLSHGIVSAALFMCVGTLYLRTHSRAISDYGGFGAQTPILFYFFLFMGMASLGLPLLMSFPGESMVFYGAFLSRIESLGVMNLGPWVLNGSIQTFTILSGLGVILGAAYVLWLVKRLFFGPIQERWTSLPDASRSEVFVLTTLAALVILYGIFPQWLNETYTSTVSQVVSQYEADSPDGKLMLSSTTGERP